MEASGQLDSRPHLESSVAGKALLAAALLMAAGQGCSPPQHAARRLIQEAGGRVVWEEGKILQIHLAQTSSAGKLLSRLPKIDTVRVLNLSGTDITSEDVQRLPDWPLTSLSLRGTKVTDACVPRILRFTELTTLILSETDIRSLDGLAALDALETLAMPPAADDDALAEVGKCARLHTLYAASTQIRGSGLVHCGAEQLPDLRTLYLDRTLVDDQGLRNLPPHQGLERVTLQGTRVGDGAAAHLAAFPRIDFLDFSRTELTDDGLHDLAKLPLLYILDLSGSKVTAEGMARMAEQRPDLRMTYQEAGGGQEAVGSGQ